MSDEVLDLRSPMKNDKVILEGHFESIFTILEENCSFRCQKSCKTKVCNCQKANLMYTDACRCGQTDVLCKNTEHFDINEDRGYE